MRIQHDASVMNDIMETLFLSLITAMVVLINFIQVSSFILSRLWKWFEEV